MPTAEKRKFLICIEAALMHVFTAFAILLLSYGLTFAHFLPTFTDKVSDISPSGEIQFEDTHGLYRLYDLSTDVESLKRALIGRTLTCQLRFGDEIEGTVVCIFGDKMSTDAISVHDFLITNHGATINSLD